MKSRVWFCVVLVSLSVTMSLLLSSCPEVVENLIPAEDVEKLIPETPSNLQATLFEASQTDFQGDSISISWDDNSNNESAFQLERKWDSSSYEVVKILGGDATSYNDLDLDTFTVYTYRVLARNSVANSGYSNTDSCTTGSLKPEEDVVPEEEKEEEPEK